MWSDIYDQYPPTLAPEQEEYLVQTVKDWCIEHGLTVRPSPSIVSEEANPNRVLATNAPVTLFPSPFPESCFRQAQSLQEVYNELYAAIADDESWLEAVLKELIEVDDFLANLWKIHLQVKEEGYAHELSLGMFRSDYMLHCPSKGEPPSLKQVEFNTISSSFGGLARLVTALHTHLVQFPSLEHCLAYPDSPLFNGRDQLRTSGVPEPNDAVETLVDALTTAHKAYGPSKSSPPLPLCVLFLVQDNERNIFDQLALATQLYNKHGIPSFRLPTSKILAQTTIPPVSSNPSRPLIYRPPATPEVAYEATIVYFRALYAPTEYNTPTSWAARHHLERSAATKCPTVLLQLAGSKKIQQVLTSTSPDHLPTFLPTHSPDTLSSLRATFAPQYSLSSSSTDPSAQEGLHIALSDELSATHVLKPQREGGGNNTYRTAIPKFLRSVPAAEYKRYVLMELIQPPGRAANTVLRSDGQVLGGPVISELGIFGACLWRRKSASPSSSAATAASAGGPRIDVLHNTRGGYLLRTKGRESDEGGVAAGFSSLDSVVLFEEAEKK